MKVSEALRRVGCGGGGCGGQWGLQGARAQPGAEPGPISWMRLLATRRPGGECGAWDNG